jgi:proline-specific peptidase
MSESRGKVDFHVGNEMYQAWFRVFGDINSGIRPLVVLHGGPGLSHHYVLPFKELHTRFNIPVIFYDQIGIGESSHLKDVPKEFWTLDLFMDELDNVLEHLGIRANVDLTGHSWGGGALCEPQIPTWTTASSPCECGTIHGSVGEEHSSTSEVASNGAERDNRKA